MQKQLDLSHIFGGSEYYFCYPMDSGPLASSIHEISQAVGVGWHFILQGIFPTQG